MSSLVQPSRHAGHDELVSWLISRWPESHPQPSLERISALCDLLGEPQKACPVIQITGTNGKGSTAIMIDALLRSMGLRTGRFSSPHLVDVTERICVDGEPISAERFASIMKRMCGMVEARSTVVGYTQRGALPVAKDSAFAFEAGNLAVRLLRDGISNQVIGVRQGKVFNMPIVDALKVEKHFRRDLYDLVNNL